MQIVIDIPEEIYFRIMAQKDYAYDVMRTIEAVERGKVLPEGHGRLIDADALETSYGLECATKYGNKSKEQQAHSYDTMMMYEIADMLDYAPTVIEADKEG